VVHVSLPNPPKILHTPSRSFAFFKKRGRFIIPLNSPEKGPEVIPFRFVFQFFLNKSFLTRLDFGNGFFCRRLFGLPWFSSRVAFP